MKAVLVSPHSPAHLAIGDAPDPQPDSHQAVVRVSTVSLNRGEVRRAQTLQAGSPLGWDLAGVVEHAARNGTGPAIGSRVVGFSRALAGWAQLCAVPVNDLAVLPDEVSLTDAATLPVAGLTALYGLERGQRLLAANVLITGATGGVGYFACQLARAMGAQVTALIRNMEHEALVRAAGAHHVISNNAASHGPYRLILDGVAGDGLGELLRCLDEDGRAVLYGVSDGMQTPIAVRDLMATGAGRIEGFHLYRESEYAHARNGLARLASLVAQGRLKTHISRTEDWREVGAVAKDLIARSYTGKAVLKVS
ncbi:MAG: NADPH2:quinone reductase [Gammaproteobacteria bacterium]|jgi:NADPH2:quinone reductase